MNPFENYFSALGKDISGYTLLTFKWNMCDASANLINPLYNYALECNLGDDLFFASAGEHRQGKKEIPHIHLNIAVPNFIKNDNESRRRNKYLLETWGLVIENLTCKVRAFTAEKNPLDRQLENTLKYCWKEDLPLPVLAKSRYILPEDVRLYMTQSAIALFEQSKDDARKRERATAVAKTLLGQIADIIKNKHFDNYTDFKAYVAEQFLRPLEVDEYPDFNNLRKAIEKMAVKKGIVPFHFFI